jgi:hypothetical protein
MRIRGFGSRDDWRVTERTPDGWVRVDSPSLATWLLVKEGDLSTGMPVARRTDPHTAHTAAAKASKVVTEARRLVLKAHYDAGEYGLTGEELEEATGRPYESVGPRRPWLEGAGWIRKSALRRPNRAGNMMQVYTITPTGCTEVER